MNHKDLVAWYAEAIDNGKSHDFALYYVVGMYVKTLTPPEALSAIPEGYSLLKNSTHEQRSWPEDATHENGNYYCSCCVCGRQFTGHKRRVLCKVCNAETVNPYIAPSPPLAREEPK